MQKSSERTQKHRLGLRTAGYRQVQIWVPDVRRQEFADECLRQVERVNASDGKDREISSMMDMALTNLSKGTEWL
ncbi:MAG: hypothetical protein JSC188_000441 [Candidatus Tokpelaia sp. JSC188]|nr:MAG: hypothetical protein JSC188_000441 [Candidatus Tokpelaia sp. JSC188]